MPIATERQHPAAQHESQMPRGEVTVRRGAERSVERIRETPRARQCRRPRPRTRSVVIACSKNAGSHEILRPLFLKSRGHH